MQFFFSESLIFSHTAYFLQDFPFAVSETKIFDKRTNGPVNAHLRSAVYTNDIENSHSIGADEALGPFFFSSE